MSLRAESPHPGEFAGKVCGCIPAWKQAGGCFNAQSHRYIIEQWTAVLPVQHKCHCGTCRATIAIRGRQHFHAAALILDKTVYAILAYLTVDWTSRYCQAIQEYAFQSKCVDGFEQAIRGLPVRLFSVRQSRLRPDDY